MNAGRFFERVASVAVRTPWLLILPIVLLTAYFLVGVRGLPLTVAVMLAALPIGSNVLLFAQRYEVLEAEVTAAVVTSTVGYLATGTLWLLLLAHLPP